MSKVIKSEIIALDGAVTESTILTLDKDILTGVAGGQPTKAVITVNGAVVYVNRDGTDPSLATENYQAYGNGGKIVAKGYDNMAQIKFAQLDGLKANLYVIYEN